jgi:8-oxo-dGTP pyrophosphatase MutT (NUDIX family)
MPERDEAPRRFAAVLIPIFANAPHDVIFVERAQHLRRHAGQIAFPGGAVDESDGGDHARAALREVEEEIGIAPAAITIVGELAPIAQLQNVFLVTPFAGVVAPGTELVVDLNEAAGAFRVPLAAIVAPGAVHNGIEPLTDGRHIETTIFDYEGMHVWGLTGHILRDFVKLYTTLDSALRVALDAQLQR